MSCAKPVVLTLEEKSIVAGATPFMNTVPIYLVSFKDRVDGASPHADDDMKETPVGSCYRPNLRSQLFGAARFFSSPT